VQVLVERTVDLVLEWRAFNCPVVGFDILGPELRVAVRMS